MPEWFIRDYRDDDAAAIAHIYNYYVSETDISFETEPVSHEEIRTRAAKICQHSLYLVAELAGQVIGYAYAKPWHAMPAYAHTFESSIYLAHDRDSTQTRGLGTALYQSLLDALRAQGNVRVLFGVLTLGNTASDRLHAKLGFKKQATFTNVGYKHGRWLGVTYWAYDFTIH